MDNNAKLCYNAHNMPKHTIENSTSKKAPSPHSRGEFSIRSKAMAVAVAALALAGCGARNPGDSQAANSPSLSISTSPSLETVPTTPTPSETAATPQQEMLAKARSSTAESVRKFQNINVAEDTGVQTRIEPAGSDGSMEQIIEINAGGTYYAMRAKLHDIGGGAAAENVRGLTLEVVNTLPEGGTVPILYCSSAEDDSLPGQGAWKFECNGIGPDDQPWRIADDFAGEEGMNPGELPIRTAADMALVFQMVDHVIDQAATGQPLMSTANPLG